MKPFSIQEEILKRVNKEDAFNSLNERPILPKYNKTKIIKKNVGWYNFCRLVVELKP